MDQSGTFARHFARLVALLMHEAGNVDEQKMSLRALVTVSRSGPVTLAAQDGELLANGSAVPAALTGVRDAVAQLAGHSISEIRFGADSRAADIIGVARILAGTATAGDGGAGARGALAALRPQTITFVTPEPAPSEAPTRLHSSEGKTAADSFARRMQQEAPTVISQLVTPDFSRVTPEDLFAALDAARTSEATTRALDDLVALAEHSVRVGRGAVVGEVVHGVVQRETGAAPADADTKRAFVLALRRLSKPALMRAVATLIPRKPERRPDFHAVLARMGEDGADALIEQVTQAQTAEDRRTLFAALGELPAAVPSLVRMLGDSRWFVVRNAADLLGEMGATAAEGSLIALLRHPDDRVRRSATDALLKLGTPDAMKGIYEAVSDTSPDVRMHAAAALAGRKDARTTATLIRAIEEEDDGDVQLAMIAALGRVATQDAVQKLVKLAEPEQRLFRKKAVNLRVAAVQALGEAGTPAALHALRDLVADKDRDVRDTATRALAHATR